ncbi:serine hydrolase domain-containing protein [Deinococcus marmoris]|uniref:serine hydrolase domain-containing protein n=1 Tax=Deinococcus marmoris TaxID=249408 RepID=UPI0004967AB6|nr:serine hydrolase domain-containing protein [Deinococcus marmoris]
MDTLEKEVVQLAQRHGFSGVVRVDQGGQTRLERAFGLAHRGYGLPNTVHTQFALASGTKTLTALTVMGLVADGTLGLSTPARQFLGQDLPLIDDAVTIEQLLAHRSGIGDYLDEDEISDPNAYLMPVPVHQLDSTESYLPVLDGHPAKFPPGQEFSYCNSGYVVLALLAERSSGVPFARLVQQRVCQPAGLEHTAFLRSDELAGDVAVGYLDAPHTGRSNVFHLPVCGSGDGGIYSTLRDIHALWTAFMAGQIVPPAWVQAMRQPLSVMPSGNAYGLGLWLSPGSDDGGEASISMQGMDAGVSFDSVHSPVSGTTVTVISSTSDGAWPLSTFLGKFLTAQRLAE